MIDNKHLPAYPVTIPDGQPFKGLAAHDGLSKLELVAAMCLQGLLSNPVCKDSTTDLEKAAVLWADALLTHLSNTETT